MLRPLRIRCQEGVFLGIIDGSEPAMQILVEANGVFILVTGALLHVNRLEILAEVVALFMNLRE
jgi:hypothetical protein